MINKRIRFVKWIANKLGYKVVMIKHSVGEANIEANVELLRYVDTFGYLSKQKPIKRIGLDK